MDVSYFRALPPSTLGRPGSGFWRMWRFFCSCLGCANPGLGVPVYPRGGQERPAVFLSSHVGQAFWWVIRDTFMYNKETYVDHPRLYAQPLKSVRVILLSLWSRRIKKYVFVQDCETTPNNLISICICVITLVLSSHHSSSFGWPPTPSQVMTSFMNSP